SRRNSTRQRMRGRSAALTLRTGLQRGSARARSGRVTMQPAFSFTAFRSRTLARVLAALSLVLLSSASNAIREASIASYVSVPHVGTSVIMRGGLFAFAGGVI